MLLAWEAWRQLAPDVFFGNDARSGLTQPDPATR